MSECGKHETLRRQGSPCPYCVMNTLSKSLTDLQTIVRAAITDLRRSKNVMGTERMAEILEGALNDE